MSCWCKVFKFRVFVVEINIVIGYFLWVNFKVFLFILLILLKVIKVGFGVFGIFCKIVIIECIWFC